VDASPVCLVVQEVLVEEEEVVVEDKAAADEDKTGAPGDDADDDESHYCNRDQDRKTSFVRQYPGGSRALELVEMSRRNQDNDHCFLVEELVCHRDVEDRLVRLERQTDLGEPFLPL